MEAMVTFITCCQMTYHFHWSHTPTLIQGGKGLPKVVNARRFIQWRPSQMQTDYHIPCKLHTYLVSCITMLQIQVSLTPEAVCLTITLISDKGKICVGWLMLTGASEKTSEKVAFDPSKQTNSSFLCGVMVEGHTKQRTSMFKGLEAWECGIFGE